VGLSWLGSQGSSPPWPHGLKREDGIQLSYLAQVGLGGGVLGLHFFLPSRSTPI
jgi:hypothetical protein